MQFLECRKALHAERQFVDSRFDSLKPVVRNFCNSFNRIDILLHVPKHMTWNGVVLMNDWRRANGNSEAFDNLRRSGPHPALDEIEQLKALADKLVVVAESSTTAGNPGIPAGLEAILSTALVMAWTAFEVLAADLWEATVNERPRLGFIALNVQPLPDDSDELKSEKRKTRLSFPAWMLLDEAFDLRNRMGTAIRHMRKWDMTRRDQSLAAYKAIFAEDHQQLEAVFRDSALSNLTAVRNVIVHNASRVDGEFKKLVRNHPVFGVLEIGDSLPLHGPTVGELLCVSFSKGKSLLQIAEQFLMGTAR